MTIICKHFQLTHSIARSTAATDGDGGNHRRKENLIFLLAVRGLARRDQPSPGGARRGEQEWEEGLPFMMTANFTSFPSYPFLAMGSVMLPLLQLLSLKASWALSDIIYCSPLPRCLGIIARRNAATGIRRLKEASKRIASRNPSREILLSAAQQTDAPIQPATS